MKLPVLELKFIDIQRKKTGEISQIMISSIMDCNEQKKQQKTSARKELNTRRASEKTTKQQRDTLELDECKKLGQKKHTR